MNGATTNLVMRPTTPMPYCRRFELSMRRSTSDVGGMWAGRDDSITRLQRANLLINRILQKYVNK